MQPFFQPNFWTPKVSEFPWNRLEISLNVQALNIWQPAFLASFTQTILLKSLQNHKSWTRQFTVFNAHIFAHKQVEHKKKCQQVRFLKCKHYLGVQIKRCVRSEWSWERGRDLKSRVWMATRRHQADTGECQNGPADHQPNGQLGQHQTSSSR